MQPNERIVIEIGSNILVINDNRSKVKKKYLEERGKLKNHKL